MAMGYIVNVRPFGWLGTTVLIWRTRLIFIKSSESFKVGFAFLLRFIAHSEGNSLRMSNCSSAQMHITQDILGGLSTIQCHLWYKEWKTVLYLNNQPTFLLVDALISRSNHQTFHVLGVLRGIKRHLLHHKNSKDEMEIPQESTNSESWPSFCWANNLAFACGQVLHVF